jgi:hypothetical protein
MGAQVPTKKGTKSCAGTIKKEINAHPSPYVPARRTRLNISNKKSRNIELKAINFPIGQSDHKL